MGRFSEVCRFLRRSRVFIAKTVNLVAVIAILAVYSSWAAQASAHDAEVREQIAQAQRAASRGPYTADGSFTGSAKGFGGQVKVEVTIENGYISVVDVVDAQGEDETWLEEAMVLPDEIVDEQTTDLDVISGATYTSSAILNATTEALQQSMAREDNSQ